MAQLLPIAGAIVGSIIGGPLGANIGWIVGTLAGSILFPPAGTTVEGPRIGDLSITSSAYGASIQKSFGTMRMGGNMIWSAGIEEVKNEKKVGGKGGGGANTQISYEYFATFAIAFGEGVAEDVTRIWADGKLIFDKTDIRDTKLSLINLPSLRVFDLLETGINDIISKSNLTFRFYPGDETQEPDSLIEADIGINKTPAFRGITYIVFDKLALKDFGNRIPGITAEITFNASTDLSVQTGDFFTVAEGGIADSFDVAQLMPDYVRDVFYTAKSSSTVGQNIIRRFQTRTMVEDRQNAYTQDKTPEDIISMKLQTVMKNGAIIMSNGDGNGTPFSLINPDSLEIVDTFGDNTGGVGAYTTTQFPHPIDSTSTQVTVQGIIGLEFYYVTTALLSRNFGILKVTDSALTYVYDSETAGNSFPSGVVAATGPGAIGQNFGECYILHKNASVLNLGSSFELSRIRIPAGATHDFTTGAVAGVDVGLIKVYTAADLFPTAAFLANFVGLMYDETDDTIILEFEGTDSGFSSIGVKVVKIDPDTGNLLWSTDILIGSRTEENSSNVTRLTDGVYSRVDGTDSFSIRTATGEIFDTQTSWPKANGSSRAAFWDSKTSSYIGLDLTSADIHKWLFFRGAGGGALLSDVVQSICLDAGLLASDIDVTDLATETVSGYMIGRQTSARNAIQVLAQSYFFDGIESDFILKFVLRDGKVSTATITQKDLAVIDNQTGDFFQETRIQEIELPRRFSVSYLDKDNDYLQGTQSAQRILNPVNSSQSNNEMGLQIAAAFTSDFAKQIAEKQLYSAWIERSNYSIKVSWKFLAIDPADIITINTDDGTTFRARVTQNDVGVGFAIEISAASEDVAQYTSTVIADAGSGVPIQIFNSTPITKLILLCSPLLRDSDDTGRTTSQLYFLMGSFGQPGWIAGTLFKSAEGTEFTEVGSIVNQMAYGSAANILGDVADPFSTDEINTLKVFMVVGSNELSSITQLEMVNGANPAALIHSNGVDVEIIQFRDVATNADGSFTLSGLLRGRRGSETFTANHLIGNTFVLLDSLTAGLFPLALSEVNQTRFYAAVTSGQLFEDADIDTKASPGNDLKPYAPVSQAAAPSGNDIDFTWERRTRVGGGLKDGVGGVPLNEDTESYEIDIFDSPSGSVVRTITGISTTSVTYTSAQQTTDGFTPPLSQITIEIYQISAQVGRGFTKEVTLDVE